MSTHELIEKPAAQIAALADDIAECRQTLERKSQDE
jgi:DNA-binding ferritin-like protein